LSACSVSCCPLVGSTARARVPRHRERQPSTLPSDRRPASTIRNFLHPLYTVPRRTLQPTAGRCTRTHTLDVGGALVNVRLGAGSCRALRFRRGGPSVSVTQRTHHGVSEREWTDRLQPLEDLSTREQHHVVRPLRNTEYWMLTDGVRAGGVVCVPVI
jgi:hypothetical protein